MQLVPLPLLQSGRTPCEKPMIRFLFVLALCCMPLLASAADITISCIGPESDDCPVAVDVVLHRETFVASFDQRAADGKWLQRQEVFWCKGMGVDSPYRWLHPAWGICEPSGTFRTLNGEFTKRQLAENGVSFSTRQVQARCEPGYLSRPSCGPTVWPPTNERLRLSCIGPDTDDCSVAVDVKLQGDGLLATVSTEPGGGGQRSSFEWCTGFSITGDAPLRWWASKGSPCLLWGTSRPLNGELTKRQLAEAYATFETRTVEAVCQFGGPGLTSRQPACTKVQR